MPIIRVRVNLTLTLTPLVGVAGLCLLLFPCIGLQRVVSQFTIMVVTIITSTERLWDDCVDEIDEIYRE